MTRIGWMMMIRWGGGSGGLLLWLGLGGLWWSDGVAEVVDSDTNSERSCEAAAWPNMNRTQNSKGLDAKTSNSTRRCRRILNKAKHRKENCKGSDWLWDGMIYPNFFLLAFSWTVGMMNRNNLLWNGMDKSHRATWNLIPLDRAKVADLSMRWRESISVEFDLDDPTTTCRGRCANAIAKPISGRLLISRKLD